MKLDIFLENMRLDVDDDLKMSIDYVFSQLSNPTIQTGDGSQTFIIKGTPNNNAVFGQIWRLDRVTLLGGELNTSVYFNASKRTKCVIYINNEVFKRGYVKLNAIKSAKGVISYDVTFYSETVDVLRTLNESKLRDLPFPNDLRHTLNADNIGAFWDKNSGNSEIAPLLPYLAYVMANNGIYDEFESGKWLTGSYDNPKIVDILPSGIELDECAKREYRSYYQRPALRLKGLIELIAEQHGIQLDPAFFNDSNPYYANSVMALPQYNIMEQSNSVSGTSSYVDNPDEPESPAQTITITDTGAITSPILPWYKSADSDDAIFPPHWDNVVNLNAVANRRVQPIVELEFSIQANIETSTLVAGHDYLFCAFPWQDNASDGILPTVTAISKDRRTDMSLMQQAYIPDNNYFSYLYREHPNRINDWAGNIINYKAWLGIFDMKDAKVNGYKTVTSVFSPSLTRYFVSTGGFSNPYERVYTGFNKRHTYWLPLRFIGQPFTIERGDYLQFEISVNTGSGKFPQQLFAFYTKASAEGRQEHDVINVKSYIIRVRPITKAPANGGNLNEYYPASAGFTGTDITLDLTKNIRSGYAVDKRDIIDDETTQGDFLINYAKLFGLLFYTDRNGTPHLVTRNTFFKNYTVEDWTQKIDHAKEIQQRPIPFDAKYLSLRYQDGGTFYEDYYRQQYETEYGEQRMNTGFDFNENETELIPDILFCNTVMSQESTRVLLQSGNEVRMCFQKDTKILPALFEKDNNQRVPSDTKFNLLFDNGLHRIVESGNVDDIPPEGRIYLTDDQQEQMLNTNESVNGGQYCWIDTEHYIVSKVGGVDHKLFPELFYPKFSTLHASGKFSWTLGLPRENYAGWFESEFPATSTIYANFWSKYIAEIYDVDNRIMTAYVRLTAADVAQFTFAKFVKIGDSLWHVNKIEQFDPLGNGTTKVEFLRVSSADAIDNVYANGQTDMSGEDNTTN